MPTRRNLLNQRVEAGETPIVQPVKSYVICYVQRTESWLLAHTLADTGYADRPSDYFDDAERQNHTREWGLPAWPLLESLVQTAFGGVREPHRHGIWASAGPLE